MRLKLDLQLFAQEKTEKATPKKRQDARKKGQVAKSMELPGAFILLFTFLFMMFFGNYFSTRIHALFTVSLHEYIFREVNQTNLTAIANELILYMLMLLAPIFIISVVLAILGNFVQIGFLVSGEPLKMKLSKLNPIEGFKRIFSMRALIEFLKSLLKVVVIGAICSMTLWREKENILSLSRLPLEQIFTYTARLVVILGLQIGAFLVFIAVLDYLYQRYDHEKNLRMSKQEVKDEFKKMEGDPLIKSRIREKQRSIAMRRMMQEIPNADVVITNPTHYAVALRYEAKEMEAPKVIAKGKDYVALKIREKAKEHGVVIMENKPLARALYEQTEIGDTIPAELFQAVAEVLAYVYRIKKKV
jgi:flagellar biosynthetic protein FlhB